MKKFEFSLAHMRDYRERLLDEEKGKLLRLRGEQNAIEQHIFQLENEFSRTSFDMQRAQAKGTTIIEIRKFSAQLDNIRMQIKELETALQKAIERVEKQTGVVLAANQEVSKLDKLFERQLEDYRYMANKAEEDRVDEFVAQNLIRAAVGE